MSKIFCFLESLLVWLAVIFLVSFLLGCALARFF